MGEKKDARQDIIRDSCTADFQKPEHTALYPSTTLHQPSSVHPASVHRHQNSQSCVCTCTVLPGNPRWQSGRHAGRSRWDNRNTTRAGITSVSCLGARRHRWYPESWRRIEGRWRTRGRPPHCWGSTRRGHCCRSRTGGWRRTETQECGNV